MGMAHHAGSEGDRPDENQHQKPTGPIEGQPHRTTSLSSFERFDALREGGFNLSVYDRGTPRIYLSMFSFRISFQRRLLTIIHLCFVRS